MRYKLKLMTGDELMISEELFAKIAAMPSISGVIKVNELGGLINLSSMVTCLSEDQAAIAEANNSKAIKRIKLHDGIIAVSKNGIDWTNEYSGTKIDRLYYPEIGRDNQPLLN